MKAKYKDEQTGEEKFYEISYSQELQKQTGQRLKLNNWLLFFLIVILCAIAILLTLIVLRTSVLDNIISAYCGGAYP